MRRGILLGILIGGLVGLIVGGITFRNEGQTCEAWQKSYAHAVEEARGGAFSFIDQGPAERLRELEAQRPEDCPTP